MNRAADMVRHRAADCAIALAALALGARLADGGTATHQAYSASSSVEQQVELLDAWGDVAGGLGRPITRDVLARTHRRTSSEDLTRVDLLLFGPWGTYHFEIEELATRTGVDLHAVGSRTTWLPLDIDADGENEIVLVRRSAETYVPLDATGQPLPDSGPLLRGYGVTLSYLDRTEDTLTQVDVSADPRTAAFSLLLERELGGAVNAALQQAAGDYLFAANDFEKARYRYLVVKEWAERSLPARDAARLSLTAPLSTPDPDDAATLWCAALRRYESLPPYFRRR